MRSKGMITSRPERVLQAPVVKETAYSPTMRQDPLSIGPLAYTVSSKSLD